jgi:hypothetical protein
VECLLRILTDLSSEYQSSYISSSLKDVVDDALKIFSLEALHCYLPWNGQTSHVLDIQGMYDSI